MLEARALLGQEFFDRALFPGKLTTLFLLDDTTIAHDAH